MAIQASDLDCQKCSETVKRIRGCEEEVEPYFIGEEEITRCPIKTRTPKTRAYIRAYNSMKLLGGQFNEGGVADQASKMVDVFCILEAELKKHQVKRR